MVRFVLLISVILGVLSGCALTTRQATREEPSAVPVMRWDHRPEAADWTQATLAALAGYGAVLPALVPSDIDQWCPHYPLADISARREFWAGLFSALAKHESTWRPEAVGGGGLWIGLVQIDPRTARGHGCSARSVAALKDGSANLRCAVRIAANQVPKRGSITRGMRDWGPFHHASKRAEMSAWTRAQAYCTGQGT